MGSLHCSDVHKLFFFYCELMLLKCNSLFVNFSLTFDDHI